MTEHDWKSMWKRKPAWNARQFTQLCCGWNPSDGHFPDPVLYNQTFDDIKLAVRISDPSLPTIDLRWPATSPELFYGDAPLFAPSRVWEWALEHYPDAFPYSASDFSQTVAIMDEQIPARVVHLLRIAGEFPAGSAQKAIQARIQEAMSVDDRTAQAYAALIRQDSAVHKDRRAQRHRVAGLSAKK